MLANTLKKSLKSSLCHSLKLKYQNQNNLPVTWCFPSSEPTTVLLQHAEGTPQAVEGPLESCGLVLNFNFMHLK